MLSQRERDSILNDVKKQMSQKRFEHVLRVEKRALELAKQYHVDTTSCQLSALLHDYAKEWSMTQYQDAIQRYGLPEKLLNYGSAILHGPVAASVVKEKYDINEEVVQAIYYHTIAHAQMSDVSKVLYIADYTEDGRQFKEVEHARELAKKSLDEAIVYRLQQTICYLAQSKAIIFPEMIDTYNAWIKIKR